MRLPDTVFGLGYVRGGGDKIAANTDLLSVSSNQLA
jgi:hypothetical protein